MTSGCPRKKRKAGNTWIWKATRRMPTPPLSDPISKPELGDYPALAAFDIKVDRKSKFPVLPLAIATVCRTIANARLRTELTKGCI